MYDCLLFAGCCCVQGFMTVASLMVSVTLSGGYPELTRLNLSLSRCGQARSTLEHSERIRIVSVITMFHLMRISQWEEYGRYFPE